LSPLHRLQDLYGHLGPVCEIFALTGHCKFGAKCTKLHPDGKNPGTPTTDTIEISSKVLDHETSLASLADSILEDKDEPGPELKAVGAKVGSAPTPTPLGGKLLFGSAFAFDRIIWGVLNDLNVMSF